MKNKEEIKQEIYELAKKISEKPSDDLLLVISREIHEKSVLLKYADNPAPIPLIIAKEEEKIIIKAEEPAKSEIQAFSTEKKQTTIDLFSSETISPVVPSPPVIEKIISRESKETKKNTTESVVEKLQHKKITKLYIRYHINTML